MVTSCWLPRFPTSSEHIKTFKIIKHQILSSWCDISFLMWSIWSKLSPLHPDSFHVWAFPTGPRCWHISKAMWRCWLSLVKLVEHWVLMDRIHPTNRTLLLGVGSGILVSQSKWEDFAEKKTTKKRETQQLHSRRGEALGVPDRLRRQARGICHGDLWSKRGNRDCTTDTCTWLKKIYFTTLMLVEEKGFQFILQVVKCKRPRSI